MQKLIILEGPDGCGKTRFANALTHGSDAWVYIHLGISDDILRSHFEALDAIREALNRGSNVVCDRFWISEEVYGTLFRNGTYGSLFARGFHDSVLELKGSYVFCLDDPTVYASRIRELSTQRAEAFSPTQLLSVLEVYRDLWFGEPLSETYGFISTISHSGGFCRVPRARLLMHSDHPAALTKEFNA